MATPDRIPIDEKTHRELKLFATIHKITQGKAIKLLLDQAKNTQSAAILRVLDSLGPCLKDFFKHLSEEDRKRILAYIQKA